MMQGSPESLEEAGPIRCLRMAGALLRLDGEPLAATWLDETSVVALDDQGVVQKASRKEGRWTCARPIQLDHIPSLAAFCGGKKTVVCSSGPELGVWSLETAEPSWGVETESWITAIATHPTLGLVASGHEDGSVRVWEAGTGNLRRCWEPPNSGPDEQVRDISISALAWHPAESRLLVADESLALLQLGLEAPDPLSRSSGHKGRIVALGFDPQNRFLYSGGWDGTVRVWNAQTGAPVILLNNHASLVTCLSVSTDGARICVGDNSPSWSIWEVPGWQKRGSGNSLPAEPRGVEIRPGGAESLITLQDGRVLAADWEGDIPSGLRKAHQDASPRPVCLREGEDSYLCLGTEGGVQRWSRKNQGSLWDGTYASEHVGDFGGALRAMAFAMGEKGLNLLTSQTGPGVLKAYQSAVARPSFHLTGVTDSVPGDGDLVALAPGGKWAVCASSRALDCTLFKFPNLDPVGILPDPLGGAASQDLAFGPCGHMLAICGVNTFAQRPENGAVVVVDIRSGKRVHALGRGVWRLAWHPDGEELLLAGVNGDLVRWLPEKGDEEVLEHTAEGPMQVVGYCRGGAFGVASSGNDELWVFEASKKRPSGTVSLPGRVIAVCPGEKEGAVVALLAGGDGWEIDLPGWLAENQF